jgi:hypothetical protein
MEIPNFFSVSGLHDETNDRKIIGLSNHIILFILTGSKKWIPIIFKFAGNSTRLE